MPYFMDRHDLPGATSDDVALAHLQDLEVQRRFDVHFLSYWFDPGRHSAFCLVESPSEGRALAAHEASHGLVPSHIIPVDKSTVEMFLGRVVDPAGDGAASSAFRVILFTDMEGSTDMTQRLGDDASMRVLRRHNSIIRTALDGHHGTEIKHTGDGLMASFASVTDGLNCAIAIQRAISAHNEAALDRDDHFQVRIGVAAGEPVAEENDLFGAAVQLAARLCGRAAATEICVSEAVSGLAIGKRYEFTSPAEFSLKGFDRPIRAVTLAWM